MAPPRRRRLRVPRRDVPNSEPLPLRIRAGQPCAPVPSPSRAFRAWHDRCISLFDRGPDAPVPRPELATKVAFRDRNGVERGSRARCASLSHFTHHRSPLSPRKENRLCDRRRHGSLSQVLKRGYWGDICNSPYFSFGVSAEPGPDREALFKMMNKQHVKTAVDVSVYNLTVRGTLDRRLCRFHDTILLATRALSA